MARRKRKMMTPTRIQKMGPVTVGVAMVRDMGGMLGTRGMWMRRIEDSMMD